MDLEIRHLRAVVALADHGSHTAAAAALHVTQPTVSRTIRQLEDITGVRLAEPGSPRLTAEAEEFVGRARTVLAEIDALSTQRASIRIGFSWLLPERWYRDVRTAAARAGLRTTLTRHDDPLLPLREGAVDISLHRNPIPEATTGIAVATVGLESRVLAVSEYDRAFPTDEPVPWRRVADHPVVVNTVSGSTTIESLPDESLAGEARGRPTVIECRNFDEWLELIAAGEGVGPVVGPVPEICARRVQHPHVRYLPLIAAPPTPVQLAWRTHPAPSRAVRRFVDIAAATPL